ncbi:hypothetical protein [Streptomyces sasae]|uniref:hypothetical protein n=1 Tax=Streptomyces sasae TaxID=1266772 RepID=UPI00292D5555|nr:hypothetical protein [Streptomyces sasae]
MGPSGGDLTTIEFAALLGREVDGFVPPPEFATSAGAPDGTVSVAPVPVRRRMSFRRLTRGVSRCPGAVNRVGSDGARAIVDEIVGHLAPEDPKPACAKALGLFAMMAGSLQLSRVAFGSKLTDEVLENALAFMC